MIKIPDNEQAYEYENAFYLTSKPGRLGKLLAHYELYTMSLDIPGVMVECGIFKGASFSRFAMMRSLLEHQETRKIVGFDIFGKFPQTNFEDDKNKLDLFIEQAGDESISQEQLIQSLQDKDCHKNIELIAGDICETAPQYIQDNPELKISLLNLDVDIYEPNVAILDNLFPKISIGGVLILDDYGIFPGATKAIDDYFKHRPEKVHKLPFAHSPSYIIKEKELKKTF